MSTSVTRYEILLDKQPSSRAQNSLIHAAIFILLHSEDQLVDNFTFENALFCMKMSSVNRVINGVLKSNQINDIVGYTSVYLVYV